MEIETEKARIFISSGCTIKNVQIGNGNIMVNYNGGIDEWICPYCKSINTNKFCIGCNCPKTKSQKNVS
jgi:hypothetical protein